MTHDSASWVHFCIFSSAVAPMGTSVLLAWPAPVQQGSASSTPTEANGKMPCGWRESFALDVEDGSRPNSLLNELDVLTDAGR